MLKHKITLQQSCVRVGFYFEIITYHVSVCVLDFFYVWLSVNSKCEPPPALFR